MNFTLRQFEYFLAVVDAGTISGAAERIPLSQSALSTSLADLEQGMGVRLLVRHHARGVTLTHEATELLPRIRALLNNANDLQDQARDLGGAVQGTLTVGCFSVLSAYVLPEITCAVAEHYPAVTLRLVEEPLDGLERGLLDGSIDVAIGYDIDLDPTLERLPACALTPHVLLPAAHPAASQAEVSLASIADDPMVLLDLPHSRDYFMSVFAAAGVEPRIAYRTRQVETARALVGRGLAYTVLALRPAVDVTVDGSPVVPVAVAGDPPGLDISVFRAKQQRYSRRNQAITDLALDCLGAQFSSALDWRRGATSMS